MSEIKVLRPEVFNVIAAGEVIEKPIGAVKELVENSIDAGASRIAIEVVGGGFELISVTDDGIGIREDDVELAFCKHATSKISDADDIYALESLGFRGEALPSIASISRIKLTTRTRTADTGVCITLEDGVVTNKEYVSCNQGTRIEVRGLYQNVPVKKKFFKSAKGEAAEITKYIARLILTNPQLQISYTLDDKLVYSSTGTGLEEALFVVYGADCLKQCLKVSYSRDGMRINGYIGNPQFTKANKTYQTLSVNGRYITDQGISSAIAQAYVPGLMTRQYPFFVLSLEIRSDQVDVNIHPKKLEVRFAGYDRVCSAFYRAAKNTLDEYKLYGIEVLALASLSDNSAEAVDDRDEVFETINSVLNERRSMNPGQAEDVFQIEETTIRQENRSSLIELADRLERELTVEKARQAIGLEGSPAVKSPSVVTQPQQQEIMPEMTEAEKFADRTRILGIAFKTYVFLEVADKVILVDQHAAHERILFDKLMAQKTNEMQQLVFPYVFTVKEEEALFIDENIDSILSAGIQIEQFGLNTYRIVAVSSLLKDTKMEEFVRFLIGSIDEFKLDDRTLIIEKIARKACRAAVKAGEVLNEYEIKNIVKELYENKALQCPHGRPITVTLTKTQIEKMFKRIV